MKIYTYRIVKENPITGERAKRCRMVDAAEPLRIGGLYMHLKGAGHSGAWRILELVTIVEE